LPFAGIDAAGEFTGLDVELARELAKADGLARQVCPDRRGPAVRYAAGQQCDALISALTPEASRLNHFAYSEPYFDAGLVLVVPAASALKQDDLKDMLLRSRSARRATRARAGWPRTLGLQVLERDTPDKVMQAVEAGLADAALTDTATRGSPSSPVPHCALARARRAALTSSPSETIRPTLARARPSIGASQIGRHPGQPPARWLDKPS